MPVLTWVGTILRKDVQSYLLVNTDLMLKGAAIDAVNLCYYYLLENLPTDPTARPEVV